MESPSPDDYQPPLTRWGQVGRLLGVLTISVVAFGPVAPERGQASDPWLWIDVVCGLAALAVVTQRRRFPLTVALLTGLLSAFSALAAGPAVLAAVSVATRRVYWQVLVVGLTGVVAGQTFVTIEPANGDPFWLDLVINVVVTAAVMGWGLYIGSRRELVWTLRHRAERAEAEQELRVSRARSTERARIAREMHDVLAHRISQISLHAGAMAYREDLDAGQLRASAAVVRDTAHQALTDLRGVLGVLRDHDTGEPVDAPQPTYDDLARLVAEARASGVPVDFHDGIDGHRHLLPDVVGRTVYRIVQEGITNARKHAPGARLSIRVSGTPGERVDVELRNPLGFGPSATPGSGLGLVGLAERAELRGGRLEGRRDGASFVLRGWIPWAA